MAFGRSAWWYACARERVCVVSDRSYADELNTLNALLLLDSLRLKHSLEDKSAPCGEADRKWRSRTAAPI